jgi:hypothetical protein
MRSARPLVRGTRNLFLLLREAQLVVRAQASRLAAVLRRIRGLLGRYCIQKESTAVDCVTFGRHGLLERKEKGWKRIEGDNPGFIDPISKIISPKIHTISPSYHLTRKTPYVRRSRYLTEDTDSYLVLWCTILGSLVYSTFSSRYYRNNRGKKRSLSILSGGRC